MISRFLPPSRPGAGGLYPRSKRQIKRKRTSYSKGAAGWRSRDGGFQDFRRLVIGGGRERRPWPFTLRIYRGPVCVSAALIHVLRTSPAFSTAFAGVSALYRSVCSRTGVSTGGDSRDVKAEQAEKLLESLAAVGVAIETTAGPGSRSWRLVR
jgi:hypothetical protein